MSIFSEIGHLKFLIFRMILGGNRVLYLSMMSCVGKIFICEVREINCRKQRLHSDEEQISSFWIEMCKLLLKLSANQCIRLLETIFNPGFTRGGLNHLCPYVCSSDSMSLDVSRDRSLVFFLIFCMELGHHKGSKVTWPDFWQKIWGVTNWGKTPFLGHFWCFLSISLKRL